MSPLNFHGQPFSSFGDGHSDRVCGWSGFISVCSWKCKYITTSYCIDVVWHGGIHFWRSWSVPEARFALTGAFSSSLFLGEVSHPPLPLLIIPHRYPVGVGSGELAGQSVTALTCVWEGKSPIKFVQHMDARSASKSGRQAVNLWFLWVKSHNHKK